MTKFLVFTDSHLRSIGQTIIGLDPYVRFQDALQHALSAHPDAVQIIHMGDVTHSGKPQEYARMAELVRNCPIPITFMPGNHDNRDEMCATLSDLPKMASGHLQGSMQFGDDLILTLDTLDGPPFRNDWHSGLLCADRLAWLSDQLDAAGDARVSIFMHHPPIAVGFAGMDDIQLANGDAFLELLRRYPNKMHLFCGHVHRTISGSANGIGFTIYKSTCHQAPMTLDVTDATASVDEPGAYGIVLFTKNAVIGHSEDYETAEQYAGSALDALPD